MKKRSVVLLALLVVLLLGGCIAGDPLPENLYTKDLFPGKTNTYHAGSLTLQYDGGYFRELYLNGVMLVPGIMAEIDPVFSGSPASGITGANIITWNGHPATTTGTHGVGTGSIVGTTLVQSLTNKQLLMNNGDAIQWKDGVGAAQNILFLGGGGFHIMNPTGNGLNFNYGEPGMIYLWGQDAGTGEELVLYGTYASAGTTLRDSPTINMAAFYWDGGASAGWSYNIAHNMVTAGATPKSQAIHSINGVSILNLVNDNGQTSIYGNASPFSMTQPTNEPASTANRAGTYAWDVSADNMTIGFFTETPVQVALGVASTNRIPVRWNNATYYLLAEATGFYTPIAGTAEPTTEDGLRVGALFFNTDTNVWKKCTSSSPVTWETLSGGGAPGAPGSKWYSGTGVPSSSLGIVGDWYLDDASGGVYEKTGEATWTLRDNLTGSPGTPGANGADGYTPIFGVDYFNGNDGAPGAPGADGYTPIKGVDYFDGDQGIQGIPGNPGPNQVTTSTTSDLTGILAADGANVKLATNNSVLVAMEQAFTTALKSSYDWLVTNITATWKTTVDDHLASTANPHSVTKAQVALTNVTDDAQVAKSLVDAKGDVITATANDTPARLASSGVNNNVLTVDTTTATGLKWAAPAGGNDPRISVDALTTGEQFDVTASVALVKITNLDVPLTAGTYTFQYYIIYRSNQLTNGIRYAVNYSGTNGAFVWNTRGVDVLYTASSATADQDEILATGAPQWNFASRAKSTTTRGTTLSVDTINADMFTVIEGVFVATGSGNLELWTASEVSTAAYTTSTMIGTSVVVTKTK